MAQSLATNLIHLIFSTKNRKGLLHDSVRSDLHAYMATVLKNMDCPALIINSVEDHVHILVLLHRTVALSSMVGDIKSISSKWLKTQSPKLADFQWQAGFGAFSVSESNVSSVRQYIKNQAEHHRKVSFQEELRSFLEKHRVEYDERYLWE